MADTASASRGGSRRAASGLAQILSEATVRYLAATARVSFAASRRCPCTSDAVREPASNRSMPCVGHRCRARAHCARAVGR